MLDAISKLFLNDENNESEIKNNQALADVVNNGHYQKIIDCLNSTDIKLQISALGALKYFF